MSKYEKKLLIFDLDGTLIDSSGDIADAANRTLKSMGRSCLSMEEIKASIGWGVRPLLEKLMPELDSSAIDTAREAFLAFYGEKLVAETFPYPGVEKTLETFLGLGKTMAVVTNKPVSLTLPILEGLSLSRYFTVVYGGDSFPNKKPHPEPILKVLERCGFSGSECVYVGDSAIDCRAGNAAGVDVIGVSYGFRGKGELLGEGCCAIVDSFGELTDIIR